MASGHVNRIKRPNTWLHRPMLRNVKKALANSEPSTHGTSRQLLQRGEMIRTWQQSGSDRLRAEVTRSTYNGLRQFAKDGPRGHKYWQKRPRSGSVAAYWCGVDAQC